MSFQIIYILKDANFWLKKMPSTISINSNLLI